MLSDIVSDCVHQFELPKLETHPRFIAWMKFAYNLMLPSSRLLELAGDKSKGELRDYFLRHAEEERAHAGWMLEDLHSLQQIPIIDHAVACIAGAQYYYIEHIAPDMLLGYQAALEFRPMPMEHVDKIASVFGERAVRTIRYHAENDVKHGAELRQIIDEHGEHGGLIAYNAYVTSKMLAHYMTERMTDA